MEDLATLKGGDARVWSKPVARSDQKQTVGRSWVAMESGALGGCDVVHKTATAGKEKDTKKLRSRHAAQSRRILENTEFDGLASALPIPRAISSSLLDKASVVRLATNFLKLNRLSVQGQPSWSHNYFGYLHLQQTNFDWSMGSQILDAVDGFLFCMAEDGTILYVSETVSIGLGLSQIEMIGNRVFDYVHYDDMANWHALLSRNHSAGFMNAMCSSVVPSKLVTRFKSSLVKRATKDTQESSLGYKTVEFYISPRFIQCSNDQSDPNVSYVVSGYACYALPLLCSSTPECKLDRSSFVITTLLDFKIHYVDARAEEILLGTKSVPVRGTSVYGFVHTSDINTLINFHKEVLKLGASTSDFFRLMCAKGGCMWTQAIGVKVNRARARQNQCSIVVMLCYAIGQDEFDESLLACHQLQHACNEEQFPWPTPTYQEMPPDSNYIFS